MATFICGIIALNSGCQPCASYAADAATKRLIFSGCRIANCSPVAAPIE